MNDWLPNPDYDKAESEVVFIGMPIGDCAGCGMPTNGKAGEFFVCSFCKQDNPDWMQESAQY